MIERTADLWQTLSEDELLSLHAEVLGVMQHYNISYKEAVFQLYMAETAKMEAELRTEVTLKDMEARLTQATNGETGPMQVALLGTEWKELVNEDGHWHATPDST